jgi:hypothetical protein
MTKRFVKVYTSDFAVPCGEMAAIPKNSRLRYRPKRVPKFRIPKAVQNSIFTFEGGDENGWNCLCPRDEFKAHFRKLFGTEVKSMESIPDREISKLTLFACGSAFVNARKVERHTLKINPSLGYHRDTFAKKLERITFCFGEEGAKFYLEMHDLIVDYIASRI